MNEVCPEPLPFNLSYNSAMREAYESAFDSYYQALAGEHTSGNGSPSAYDILCFGYELDHETALTIAEKSRQDALELRAPEKYLTGLTDTKDA